MEQSRKQPKLWPSVLVMAGLVLLAFFVFAMIVDSTAGFRKYGLVWAPLIAAATAVYLLPLTGILLLMLKLLRKWVRFPRWVCGKLFTCIGLAAFLCLLVLGLLESRPKSKLMRVTSGAADKADNIEAAGFNSFLARRWLFSFDVSEEEAATMAQSLELEPLEGIDLQNSLGRDIFFKNLSRDLWQNAPGENNTLSFYRETKLGEHAVTWMTFVYSGSAKRAWLFTGYQN